MIYFNLVTMYQHWFINCDGMASLTRWMWVWVNSGSWWWTGRPGMLRFLGSQRGRTQLSDWTELNCLKAIYWKDSLVFFFPYSYEMKTETRMESITLLLLLKRLSFFFLKLLILYWGIANQQCCDSFRWTWKGLGHIYTWIYSPPNSPPIQAAT